MVRMPRAVTVTGMAVFIFLFAAQTFAQMSPAASTVETRAESILKQMTLEEKLDYIGGVDGFFIRAIPRLSVPRLKMADGPIGVRNFGPATTMAGGIALAASWNPTLAAQVGTELGRDARAKGVHFLLGPGVNIYVAPMNGRNFEYFGEDPFLASHVAVNYIKGVQSQGVSATIKHFMANSSEFDRHNVDAVIDERTMREIYLPTFEAAVKQAHVGAIMDSYNLVNGAHMTQNGYLNTDVAKKQWGFKGIIMSDWTATYDAVAAANGGLDLEMPYAKLMSREALASAIQRGDVKVETIDEKVRSILRTAISFGWFDRDQQDLSISRYNQQGDSVALEAAHESMVLLKNEGGLLPLSRQKTKTIAIIGPNAHPGVPVGGGSARVEPFSSVSFLGGIAGKVKDSVNVSYSRGIPSRSELAQQTTFRTAATGGRPGVTVDVFNNPELSGSPVATHVQAHINADPGFDGSTIEAPKGYSVRWTGYYVPEKEGVHEVFVQGPGEGGGYRLYVDDKLVIDDWLDSFDLAGQVNLPLSASPHKIVVEQYRTWKAERTRLRLGIALRESIVDPAAKSLASKADVVVLAVGFDPETESEGADRTFALPVGEEELVREISAVNKNVIVVITSGGGTDMANFLDHVPAVIEAWYPGQAGGTALADILFGDVNPSGRLPITFESRWEDNPAHDSYYPAPGATRISYGNGIFVGYRGYEHNNTKPLFPFGFGLSYTTFKYSNLAVKTSTAPGSLFEVSFDVTNTGGVAGADVAQVYVGDSHAKVPRPIKELKGFSKVSLRPGETRHLTIPLDVRAFSFYDVSARKWHAESGDYDVLVGRSSADIQLKGVASLKQTALSD
jgi:beta-glucosidase